ncbi:uncharacterized protein BP5553_08748 [Venustampulla echinocandica]|uniref:Thioredoxin reductase n=1 Tax=Venustampulla echinocandica TaxID=2656787 RepID=A0A370TF51_9HELO|nr:uncharacterized protein BP5553_08748 [Venustampulla echinocandica]RDL33309.1 hypothetical protein BP5553_08748 [Venustampulla echinocandica]
MEHDDFANVSWQSDSAGQGARLSSPNPGVDAGEAAAGNPEDGRHGGGQPARNADPMDLAGMEGGVLECTVSSPIKENDGSKDAYVSYLVTTNTTFPSFQKPKTRVRRRFTDFVFLYKTLFREYPACAVPPLPDKHKMEYVRGDRFGPDFTSRRANSLQRFLARLSLHPILRRSALLIIFLESSDWNATMKIRPQRGSSASEQGASGVFDNFTDTFINAFTKVHKPDKRFIEVREKSDKLDEDLGHVEKIVARVARREGDLETDFKDLAEQFQKLIVLEPGVEPYIHAFAASVEDTSAGTKTLKEHTDQDYLGSLRDMQAYSLALKNLLKAREQKQLDFEQLTEYLTKSTSDRDILASPGGSLSSTAGFIRSKIEDVRGVDHEQSRRERLRKLELRIEELTREVEEAKKTTEAFDEEVVREVGDFERIKRIEFKTQFRALADTHVEFYGNTIDIWEKYLSYKAATAYILRKAERGPDPFAVKRSLRSGLSGFSLAAAATTQQNPVVVKQNHGLVGATGLLGRSTERRMHSKVVIIGSGPAAHTAAVYLARAELKPVMYEGFLANGIAAGGQLTTTTDVENYPGFPDGISGSALMDNMRKQSERFGTEIFTETVVKLDLSKRPFKYWKEYEEDKEPHTAEAIIIATGASARRLGLPGEEQYWQNGISACAVCDGAVPIFRNKPLVVIGGGDSAAEEAMFLTKYGSHVTVLVRKDFLRASKTMANRLLANKKVTVRFNTVGQEVKGDDRGLMSHMVIKNVKTGQEETMEANGLFYAVGHDPATALVKGQIDCDDEGYVLTKPGTSYTTVEGVFAAGDVQDKRYRQAITSAGSGCIAALEAEKFLAEHEDSIENDLEQDKNPKKGVVDEVPEYRSNPLL